MAAQNQEADALKSTIIASGRGGRRPEPPDKKKKAKDVQDTIAGKRLLKMSVARQLCPWRVPLPDHRREEAQDIRWQEA